MKKGKKIAAIAMAAMLSAAMPVGAFAGNAAVEVDGIAQSFTGPYMNADGNIMVPAKELAALLGASYSWTEASRAIVIKNSNNTVEMTVGSTKAAVNGAAISATVAPRIGNNTVLVPLRFVTQSLGYTVGWDDTTKTPTITTGGKMLSVLALNRPITNSYITMTYQEAIDAAYKANSSVQNLKENVDLMLANRKNAANTLFNGAYFGMDYDGSQAVSLAQQINSLESQLSTTQLQTQVFRDNAEYLVLSNINAIANYEMQITLAQANLDLQEKNIKNLELKKTLGMASDNDVLTAKNSYNQSKSSFEQLKISLANQKQTFEKSLGMDGTKEVIVDYIPSMKRVSVNDIDQYATGVINEAPSIITQQKQIEVDQYNLNTWRETPDDSGDTTASLLNKQKLEMTYNQDARKLEDMKKELRVNISTIYNQLKAKEENEKALQLALDKARNDYSTTLIQFKVGNITQYEVDQAKLAILKAEIDLKQNEYAYILQAYSFEKPYLS